jgi:O-antigen ligase
VWIGAAAGVIVVLAMTLRGRVRLVVLGGALAAGLLVGLTRMDSLMAMQREDTAADAQRSVSMRGSFAYVSWKMFLDRPVLGFGFGQFREAKLAYLGDRSTELWLEAIRSYSHHNTFLSLLTETGLVGLTLFVAILAGWVRAGWQLARSSSVPDWVRAQGVLTLGVVAIYVCVAMFHEMSYTPIDNALLFLLAGITVGLRQQMLPRGNVALAFRNLLRWPAPSPNPAAAS